MKEIDKIVFDARTKLAEETVIKQKTTGEKYHRKETICEVSKEDKVGI